MEIEYTRPWLAPYQVDALFCPERYGICEATTKAGKTAGCLIWLAEQTMAGKEGHNFWWVAPVHRQAMIAYRRMKRGLPRELYQANDSEQRLILANGAMMWFLSGEKPDNLYGEDVYAAVIDEASRVREESWHAVRSTLTATRGPLRIIGNVKGRGNWFYKMARRAESGEQGMHHSVITALDAVEAGILHQDEIEDARRNLPKSVFDELYMAIPSDSEGRVYRNFSYAENVSSDTEDLGGDILVGMDFNVDPMSAVLASKAGDELHVWGEIVIRNGNTEEMAQELKSQFPGRSIRVYPDPSGKARKTSAPVGQTDFTILREHGMAVIAPNAAPAVVDRVNEVNALLCNAEGRRRLQIHPDCRHLTEALDDLIYKEGTSQPDKGMGLDHICLAGDTRVDTPNGPVPIADLAGVGEVEVLTLGGRPVRAIAQQTSASAQTVTVTFDDGESLRVTPDHPFLTDKGWVRAVDLYSGHCYNEICITQSYQTRFKNLMASGSIAVAGISAAMGGFSIGAFGRKCSGLFRPATIFTILTAIRRTTARTTLPASRRSNTYIRTLKKSLLAWTASARYSLRSVIMPMNGTAAIRAGSGTESITKRSKTSFTKSDTCIHAMSAALSSSPTGPAKQGFAPRTAKQRIEGSLASIARRASVAIAAKSMSATGTRPKSSVLDRAAPSTSTKRVVSVSKGKAEAVYNLYVPSVGMFRLANGVVTSNCDAIGYLVHMEFPINKPMKIKVKRARGF